MDLKRLLAVIFLCGGAWTTMAAHAEVTYSVSDGSSLEHAVVITGATGETEGVRSEYAWLSKQYPGYRPRAQSVVRNNERTFDRLEIQTANGQLVVVYFDITSFFGKLD